jgi:hypothetical protein
MPKRRIDVGGGRPLLDIRSYARRGPGQRVHLSREEIDLIQRTVTRTPEVVVKVLTRGGQNLKAVRAHFEYLNRRGELEIQTDHGERLAGDGVAARLVTDWDLDVEEFRRRSELRPEKDRAPPKLVHKMLFSMPPGTDAKKVSAAVKNFAREEFGVQHRYAMVLHTDEPHPHVHLVVKAVSETGRRLNIRKATLRRWRSGFAQQLRELGVAANATERVVRGAHRPNWHDAIYRADLRGESNFVRKREASPVKQPNSGYAQQRQDQAVLLRTRGHVEEGWRGLAEWMTQDGERDVANQIRRFVEQMPPVYTDTDWLAARTRERSRELDAPTR